jgi:hypothetical protein
MNKSFVVEQSMIVVLGWLVIATMISTLMAPII